MSADAPRLPPKNLEEAIVRLKESNDSLAAVYNSERPSKPPSASKQKVAPVVPVVLTRERAAEIEKIIQERALLGAFGVTPEELAAFTLAAKRGVK